MSEAGKVLVVEDEKALLLGIEENLKHAGYEVILAQDGPEALSLAMGSNPNLILLDIMLPSMSGYDIARKLRDEGSTVPIIMLTARTDEFDKLHGFEMGADDYVTKPFSVKELLARVKAVMGRGHLEGKVPAEYLFGDLRVDMEARLVTKNGEDIGLTRTEFDLLVYFCRNEGKALSREVVMNDVWETEYYGTQRSLDSFVSSLRSKIEVDAHNPKYILTIHGVGYKFLC